MNRAFKLFLVTIALLLIGEGAFAQIKYGWSNIEVDSTWNEIKDLRATEIIAKYEPMVAPLKEIIGYSKDEYFSRRPESPLSNFAADVIREIAQKHIGSTVDIGRTNFGGIRSSLPKGAVRVYDILSIFPFNNTIVVLSIRGDKLKKIVDKMAYNNKFEAMSGIEIVARDNKIVKALIDGKPIDDKKIYKVATIDFLITGGFGTIFKEYAQEAKYTDILIRDAIIEYIKEMTARGETIDLKCDGRMNIDK